MTSIKLVTPPTADEEIKASVIEILKEALALAEAGIITSAILIMGRVDGTWQNKMSETAQFSQAIGMLEITKQEWIKHHVDGQE